MVDALRSGEPCTLLLNGAGVSERSLQLVSRIAQHTGAKLLGDTFISRIPRGAGRVDLERLPYFAEQAEEALAGSRHLILVGTKAPVSFFAYPGRASELTPEGCQAHTLAAPEEDAESALEAVVEAIGAGGYRPQLAELNRPSLPDGALEPGSIARSLAALMPENAILVNEAATSGFAIPPLTATSAPHDWLDLTGGSIGIGLPLAVGAAVACPDRRVVALQADGSGMYTVQALWTMAREGLDVTTIVFANRKYAILQVEFMRVGAHKPGPEGHEHAGSGPAPGSELGGSRPRHGRAGAAGDRGWRLQRCAGGVAGHAGSICHRSRHLDRRGNFVKVTLFGTGYVGLVTGACFAERGNDVLCVDVDAAKVASLFRGEVPIFEPGLEDMVRRNLDARRLTFTTDANEGVQHGEVIFIAVGTPPDEDGSADLQYVLGRWHAPSAHTCNRPKWW